MRFTQIFASRAFAVAAAGTVALVAAGGFTYAQVNTPAATPQAESAQWGERGWGHGWGHGMMMGRGGGRGIERFCERDPLRFQGVVRAYLKADLDLNAAQSAELDKLGDVVVPALRDVRDEVCNNFAQRGATSTAPERLEKLAQVLRKAATAAETAVAPTRSFYTQLDDRQKARVEELTERGRRWRDRDDRDGRGDRGGPPWDRR